MLAPGSTHWRIAMSIYIEDDRKVIQTTRGYIFMTLGGDSNVTEPRWIGGKRGWTEVRARSWSHLNHQILEATEPEIMAFCERVYSGSPEHDVFRKGGRNVLCKEMPNYFRSGIRRAQSIETLLAANPGQSLEGTVIVYPTKDSCSSTREMTKFLHTTQELEEWLDLARAAYQQHCANGAECYIHLAFSGKEPLRYGSGNAGGKVVVKSTSRKYTSYVCDFIPGRQLSFTGDLEKALVFDSEESARTALGYCWKDIKFVSYASQFKETAKPFVILFGSGGLCGRYLQKQSSTKVYGSLEVDRAMHFASVTAATRYAEGLRAKGWDTNRCKEFTVIDTRDNSRTTLTV